MDDGNDLQFDEDHNLLYARVESSSKTPKLVQFVVNTGIAKDEKTAMYVLVGVAVLIIIVTILLFATSGSTNVPLTPPSET